MILTVDELMLRAGRELGKEFKLLFDIKNIILSSKNKNKGFAFITSKFFMARYGISRTTFFVWKKILIEKKYIDVVEGTYVRLHLNDDSIDMEEELENELSSIVNSLESFERGWGNDDFYGKNINTENDTVVQKNDKNDDKPHPTQCENTHPPRASNHTHPVRVTTPHKRTIERTIENTTLTGCITSNKKNTANFIELDEQLNPMENIKITQLEYEKLIKRFDKQKVDQQLPFFSSWLYNNPKKSKSNYASLINWIGNSHYVGNSHSKEKVNPYNAKENI